jgi:hypothetical protein
VLVEGTAITRRRRISKIVTSRDVGNADTGLHAEKLDLNERVADELSMRVKVLVVSTVKLGS